MVPDTAEMLNIYTVFKNVATLLLKRFGRPTWIRHCIRRHRVQRGWTKLGKPTNNPCVQHSSAARLANVDEIYVDSMH